MKRLGKLFGKNTFKSQDGSPVNNRLDSVKGLKRFAPHKQVFGKLGGTNKEVQYRHTQLSIPND